MTKEDAILLAVANARGLVTLTAVEASEVSFALSQSARDLRHALAAAKVAEGQKRVASHDPTAPYGLGGDIEELKQALEHQREVGDMVARDLSAEYARARARSLSAPLSNPVIDAYVAAKPTDAS
jgi:hypothetical protein